MRCKGCDYALWNLPPGNCPECGLAFKLSDYEFVPNAVRFCCPRCKQHYFGTSPTGHLEPESFVCVSCGDQIGMDEMLVQPAEGVPEELTARNDMPWINRERYGFLRALRKTFYLSLGTPGRLVSKLPLESRAGAAFIYAAWIGAAITLISVLAYGVLIGFVLLGVPGGGPAPTLRFVGEVLLALAAAFLGWVVLLCLWALLGHIVLLVTGKREGGLGRTFECACYASGASFLLFIPGCGWYFWWIWPIVAFAIMLHARQMVHGVRAAFAALALPLLLMLAYVVFVVALIVIGASAQNAAMAAATTATAPGSIERTDVLSLSGSLESFREREGRMPAHAIDLIKRDTTPSAFIATNSMLTLAQAAPLGVSLDTLSKANPDERSVLIDEAITSIPTGAVAHRVGDFVFTYHGFDPLLTGFGELWTVIEYPVRGKINGANFITCARADGVMDQYPKSVFSAAVAKQNGLRRLLGAPEIPHPMTVPPEQPATGP